MKKRKTAMRIIALIALIAFVVAICFGNPGVAVCSGCVCFIYLIIAISGFMDGCEKSITGDDDL